MTLIAYIIATLLALFAGYGILSLLTRPGMRARSFYEQIGLSYIVGIVYLGTAGLLLGRLKLPVTFWTVAATIALPVAVIAWRVLVSGARVGGILRMNPRSFIRNKWWQWILIALILVKVAYLFSMSLTELRRTDDAFKCWLVLAKHVQFEHTPSNYELPGNYPKLVGMHIFWIGGSLGEWSEFKANLAYFNFALFFLLLFYGNLHARTNKGIALAGTYALSTMPILLNHAVLVGYADLPMAIFLTLTGLYAYRYASEGRRDDLILAVFFLLIMPQIKNEGLVPYFPFGAYAIAAAWVFRRGRPRMPLVWIGTGAAVLLGLVAVAVIQATFGDSGPPKPIAEIIHWGAFRPGNHWAEVKAPLLAHFGWHFNNWLLAGTLAPLAIPFLAIRFRSCPEAVIALFAILLLIAFVYLFCFSVAYQWLVQGTTVNRTYLQMVPTFLFACAVMIGRWHQVSE